MSKVSRPGLPSGVRTTCDNYIDGSFVPPCSGTYTDVSCPLDGANLGSVALSSSPDVLAAVASSSAALPGWSHRTLASRGHFLHRFYQLASERTDLLSDLIVLENGKNAAEARADVAKGLETVAWAMGLSQAAAGRILDVSSGGVACRDRRDPVGVVGCVVPFNFPFMVPMWTLPIALMMGNTVVMKPSEKVPLTMTYVAGLFEEAGLPKGVLNLLQGSREAVEGLIDHEDVRAFTFVGSSPVAKLLSSRAHALHKRNLCLGGAKNHLVALPDCHLPSTVRDIVASFAGCAGQRCMAASVLVVVGPADFRDKLIDAVVERTFAISPGTTAGTLGPVIDGAARERIERYLADVDGGKFPGAKVLLDGRNAAWRVGTPAGGSWIGPSVLLHQRPGDAALTEEIFGPVLSVIGVATAKEALDIENASPFGNAACVYTTDGGKADWFTARFRAAMLGVNVGIPVPREPFSFGGLYGTRSKYGDGDITGEGAMEFFSQLVKVTTRWPKPEGPEFEEGATSDNMTGITDHANFNGRM